MMNNSIFIYSSVGSTLDDYYKSKVFNSWEIHKFNSGCSVYQHNEFNYKDYFKTVINNKNYKFPNFFNFDQKYKITNQYNYIAILDDDLLFNQINSIEQTIKIMKRFNISLCSLSNDNTGKKTGYKVMHSDDTQTIHITNFCEMGCMIFERKFLKFIKNQYKFYNKLVDWGFDWWICSLAEQFKYKIGVIKHLSFYNPIQPIRDVGKDAWTKYKNDIKPIESKTYKIIQC